MLRLFRCSLILLVCSQAVQVLTITYVRASTEKKLQKYFDETIEAISTAKGWSDFLKQKTEAFPTVDKSKTFVKVEKEEIKIDGETFTIGIGYRQALINTSFEKIKRILNSPELFKNLFFLDKTAVIDETYKEITKQEKDQETFRARIFKSVPLISNQDYVLEYKNFKDQDYWFQRARLVKDAENFAVRDNIKVLENTENGIVFREVSYVYVLRWYVRAMGPSMRSIMHKEMIPITNSLKCLAEKEEVSEVQALNCWNLVAENKTK